MAFIKRHLFYIVLVATVALVTGSVWAGFIRPTSDRTAKEIKARVALANSLSQLKRGGANLKMVEARKTYVEDIRRQRKLLEKTVGEMNQQGREPLTIAIAGSGESFAAFPVDRDAYQKHSLAFLFGQVYLDAMDALYVQLNSTEPVTLQEVDAATRKMERYLVEKARVEKAEEDGEQAHLILPAGVDPPFDPDPDADATGRAPARRSRNVRNVRNTRGTRDEMGGGMDRSNIFGPPAMGPINMGPTPGPARTARRAPAGQAAQLTAEEQARARREAINNLMVIKVQNSAKPIYADRSSFSPYLLPAGQRADLADMWKANVNYWLHKHIVDSINATNTAAPQQPLTIETAVVKRLVATQIGSSSGSTTTAANLYDGETTPVTPVGGGGMGGMGMRGMGMRGMGMGGMGMRGGAGTGAESTLTGRTCNAVYDVINFQVTVVVDAALLPMFLQHLTRGDFYTIQKINLYNAYAPSSTTTTGNRTGLVDADFYYGANPVVKAVIDIESLLFCDWERDLMPIEMLRRLPAQALRPADLERISKAS